MQPFDHFLLLKVIVHKQPLYICLKLSVKYLFGHLIAIFHIFAVVAVINGRYLHNIYLTKLIKMSYVHI